MSSYVNFFDFLLDCGREREAISLHKEPAAVEVSLARKEAVVEYDDEKVTEAKLREVINSTGFKAVEEQAEPKQ